MEKQSRKHYFWRVFVFAFLSANSINAENCRPEVILYVTPLKSAITLKLLPASVVLVRSKSDDAGKKIASDIKAQMKEEPGSENLKLWRGGGGEKTHRLFSLPFNRYWTVPQRALYYIICLQPPRSAQSIKQNEANNMKQQSKPNHIESLEKGRSPCSGIY